MREKEISLLDLIVEILLKWRIIILLMLIGGVIFAGLSYVKSYQEVAAQENKVKEAQQQLEEMLLEVDEIKKTEGQGIMPSIKMLEKQMTEIQKYNVNYVLTYEQLYQNKIEYIQNSVLMQMDANDVKRAEATFRIKAEDMTRVYNIEKTYEDIVGSGQLFERISEETGVALSMVGELIGLERSSYTTIEGTDILRVFARHADEQTAEQMMDVVIEYITEESKELQQTLGTHEITIIESSVIVDADTDIFAIQKNNFNELAALEKGIADLKDKFGKLEWQYYDISCNGELTELSEQKIQQIEEKEKAEGKTIIAVEEYSIEDLEKIIEAGVTATPHISIKYIALGMILFAFMYIFIIVLMSIFNNNICVTDSLQILYGINQLGMIPNEKNRKKAFAFVDQFILSFRYRRKRRFTEQEALQLAVVATQMVAEKNLMDTVYVIGCELKEHSLHVCEQIRASLQQKNIQVKILNNILYDAQQREQLVGAKGVVLVEKAGSTLYEEIAQELDVLKSQNIVILGGIIVE